MMAHQLRTYLMLRSSSGKWSVTVCRDLGVVMNSWNMRTEPDLDVAVLHIGFDRPPLLEFEQIAKSHLGCVLLTAAAKHALPNSFVASATAVGVAANTDVFVGLKG